MRTTLKRKPCLPLLCFFSSEINALRPSRYFLSKGSSLAGIPVTTSAHSSSAMRDGQGRSLTLDMAADYRKRTPRCDGRMVLRALMSFILTRTSNTNHRVESSPILDRQKMQRLTKLFHISVYVLVLRMKYPRCRGSPMASIWEREHDDGGGCRRSKAILYKWAFYLSTASASRLAPSSKLAPSLSPS